MNTLDRYPQVATLWDDDRNGPDVDPSQVLAGSNKEHWWTCPKGHVWRAPVRRLVEAYRIAQVRGPGQPFGCRQCTRRNQTTGSLPTLADSHPELLEEWDWELNPGLDPWR